MPLSLYEVLEKVPKVIVVDKLEFNYLRDEEGLVELLERAGHHHTHMELPKVNRLIGNAHWQGVRCEQEYLDSK